MKQLKIISFVVLLMTAAVIIVGRSITATYESTTLDVENKVQLPILASETGAFKTTVDALNYMNIIDNNKPAKSMSEYYKNRAYHGAPPTIPHEVSERSMGDNSCLQCHKNGGYVDKYKAYAPIVPHPDMINCRQCHVPVKSNTVFKESNWELIPKIKVPVNFNNVLLTSPPVIPHQLEMHESCLSCHAGPSAPKEIRVTHPERINCRQCHVINNKETIDIGEFARKPKMNN
ncbi:MAG: nitrate reductase cytochrome c-type subunit [Flavobacteriaceae bacterium]|nr:nitrate reductase cytochrome c-type subunit [Flavobacteriaceae bacterium]